MGISAPLGLLAAGLTVPLVAWYLLRSRRPRMTVASTFLWQQTDRNVAAAVPWQRFRGDLTFWLVLLALLLGTLAVAQPFRSVPARLGDHTILVVDSSGSMLADEGGPTRLELARREVDDLLGTIAPGQQVSVVEAGARARVLLSASEDPGAVADALRSVRIGHGPADLGDAFTLAAALQRPGQQTVVQLLTDGELPPEHAADAPAGLRVTAVGQPRPNLAVTRLQAVPTGAGSSQVFVEVRNFGQEPSQAELTLTVADEEVVSERFRLGPREASDRVLTVQGGDGDVLRADVRPVGQDLAGGDRRDHLSLDDRAFALLTAPREVAVTLATPGNVFLEAAVEAVPGVEVTVVDRVPDDLDDVDVLVVDRLPSPAAATVPTMLVGPTTWPTGVTTEEEVEQPTISFQESGHELLADVDVSEVGIATATPLTAPALTPLVGGPQGDLVLAGRLDGVPVITLGFDLLQSNLPLTATWPVFVANATTWLAGPPATVPAQAGQTLTLTPPQGAATVEVDGPSGTPRTLAATGARVTFDEVGLWRLSWTDVDGEPVDGPGAVAVNALPSESDLSRPAPVAAEDGPDDEADAGTAAEGRAPFGRSVLVLVLVLAVGEWLWVYVVRPWRRRRARRRRAAAVGLDPDAAVDTDPANDPDHERTGAGVR